MICTLCLLHLSKFPFILVVVYGSVTLNVYCNDIRLFIFPFWNLFILWALYDIKAAVKNRIFILLGYTAESNNKTIRKFAVIYSNIGRVNDNIVMKGVQHD